MNKEIKDISLDDLNNLTYDDILEYKIKLEGSDDNRTNENISNAAATIARKLAAISSMYLDLLRGGKVENNPCSLIKRPDASKDHVIVHMSDAEKTSLMNSVMFGTGLTNRQLQAHNPIRDTAIFSLLLKTGLRVSELVGLDMSDINFDDHSILIVGKGGKHAEVYVSDQVETYLQEYMEERENTLKIQDAEKALFLSFDGHRLGVRSIEKLMKKYCNAAKLLRTDKLSPHKCRSTFAMDFYEKNPDLLLLKDLMRHSKISTTNVYAEATKKAQKDARNTL